jgi:saccharopine dehydrogenase-like NADP-dependent oxidoreductase
MNILVIGAGGVGASMASIAETRSFFTQFVLADINRSRAEEAIALLDDRSKFIAEQVDARDKEAIKSLIHKVKADVVVNACDPRMNEAIFSAAFESHCNYIDMAMNLSEPHQTNPYEEVGVPLGKDQLAADPAWRERGILALVGMGVEPGLSDVFARYAADNLFDTIDEIGVRDGSNLSIDGLDFAPTFSIWTTIEECLNPPIVWEKNKGLFTTDCFSEPEVFHFPAGIGPYECVNVEHEEVLLIPREIECNRVTFKYSLGAEFIDWLKTFAYLGLDSKEHVRTSITLRITRRQCAIGAPKQCCGKPQSARLWHLSCWRTEAGSRRACAALKHSMPIHFSTCLVSTVRTTAWSRWVLDYGQAQNQLASQVGTGQ